MKKENLKPNIQQAIISLIELIEVNCWNNISKNHIFIISEIPNSSIEENSNNWSKLNAKRRKENQHKIPTTFDEAIVELEKMYENLYDINLYIYQAKKDKTIIEIRYYPKSHLEKDFFETVKNEEPMIHSKLLNPKYRNNSEKFDVNWEFGGIKYFWKLLWWKLRIRRKETKLTQSNQ